MMRPQSHLPSPFLRPFYVQLPKSDHQTIADSKYPIELVQLSLSPRTLQLMKPLAESSLPLERQSSHLIFSLLENEAVECRIVRDLHGYCFLHFKCRRDGGMTGFLAGAWSWCHLLLPSEVCADCVLFVKVR
jgi:hypothetical protein